MLSDYDHYHNSNRYIRKENTLLSIIEKQWMNEFVLFLKIIGIDCNKKSVTAQYVSGAISSHPCLTMNMICSLDSYSINLSWEKVCMSVSIIVYYMYLLFIQYLITVSNNSILYRESFCGYAGLE